MEKFSCEWITAGCVVLTFGREQQEGCRGGVGDTVFRGQGSRIVQWGGGVGVKEDGLLRISSVGRGVTC